MAAAHESTSDAVNDGAHTVPTITIEQAQEAAVRLARDFSDQPPLARLLAARALRDLARQMAEATRKPRQAADLYQVIGQTCGIMALASFDLAIWPAAMEQARAAVVYADLIDDASMGAWAHGTLAFTAFWSGHPREAADYAERGLRDAPTGSPRARLHSIAARAWSHLGDDAQVRASLTQAARERDAISSDPLHDGIGGQFGWGPARQAMSEAAAWLQVGRADEAAATAEDAIRLRAGDGTGTLVDVKASVDLAGAELLRGRLDAVEAALTPAWDVGPEFREHGLVARLESVGEQLHDLRHRWAPEARRLKTGSRRSRRSPPRGRCRRARLRRPDRLADPTPPAGRPPYPGRCRSQSVGRAASAPHAAATPTCPRPSRRAAAPADRPPRRE